MFLFSVIHYCAVFIIININHSVLRLFTGFAVAAFIAWKLIVRKAMTNAPMVAAINTHH